MTKIRRVGLAGKKPASRGQRMTAGSQFAGLSTTEARGGETASAGREIRRRRDRCESGLFWARASATQPKQKTEKTGKNKAGPKFAISLDKMVISEARLPTEIRRPRRAVPNSQASFASDAAPGSSPASEAESQRAGRRRPQSITTTAQRAWARDRHSSLPRRRMDTPPARIPPVAGQVGRMVQSGHECAPLFLAGLGSRAQVERKGKSMSSL